MDKFVIEGGRPLSGTIRVADEVAWEPATSQESGFGNQDSAQG